MADAGSSIEERAENGEHEEEYEEFFPRGVVEHDGKGPDVIFRKHRNRVETHVAISRGKVPLKGGLLEPDSRIRLLVTGEVSHYIPRPTRGNDGKQDGWEITTILNNAFTEALGEDVQAVESLFRKVLEDEPSRAGDLLGRLRSLAEEHLPVA